MKKYSILAAVVLLLVGSAMFHWVITERAKEVQLQCQQVGKYNDRLDMVSQFLSGKMDVQTFAQKAPEGSWQQEVDSSLPNSSRNELAYNISIICLGGGILVVVGWVLYGLVRLILCVIRGIWRLIARLLKLPTKIADVSKKKTPRLESVGPEMENKPKEGDELQREQQEKSAKRKWLDFQKEQPMPGHECFKEVEDIFTNSKIVQVNTELASLNNDAEKITQLFSDMESTQNLGGSASLHKAVENKALENHIRKTVVTNEKENPVNAPDNLKAQADNLEKQVAQFSNLADNTKKTSGENTEPLKDTLKSLAEQVSAIREYASSQQERMHKLQEGYDWNIIKAFCLRIIRCIDNVENRIENLSQKGEPSVYLEEFRNELIFALESSGIESFEPEINSEYSGQEKIVEAIGERQNADDPSLKGKIAKVLRKGYQYAIDENNVKVVRIAQVKLFG